MDLDAPKQRDLLYLFNHCGFQIAASLVQPKENKKLKLFQIIGRKGERNNVYTIKSLIICHNASAKFTF